MLRGLAWPIVLIWHLPELSGTGQSRPAAAAQIFSFDAKCVFGKNDALTKSFDGMVQISKVNPSEANKMDLDTAEGGRQCE